MKAAHVVALFLLPAAAVFAQPPAVKTTNELPPRIAALVPRGMRVVQQLFTYAPPSMAGAQFSTEKDLPEYHHLTYDFDMHVNNANSPTWKMQGPIYKQQVDQKIAQEAQSPQPSNAVADAPIVTPYGWGSGITRRIKHHPPQSKEYVDYTCVYFGIVGGVTFDLHVSGMQGSCEAADKWAANVALTAGKITDPTSILGPFNDVINRTASEVKK
jgi:hypothetical protein